MSMLGGKTGIPAKSLHLMAEKMGIDLSEVGSQAEQMWSMLNDLRDSNPDEYNDFIRKQMEAAKMESISKGKTSFTPQKGFVVKSKTTAGITVFVNICQHHIIQKPLDGNGLPIDDKSGNFFDLQIPLLVSSLRSIMDASGNKAHSVDVVVHPWCISTCQINNIFKANLIELGLGWVKKEHSISLDRQWKVIKSQYKGGVGENKKGVQIFPITDDMLGHKGAEKHKTKKGEKQQSMESPNNCKEKTSLISNPADLLNKLKSTENVDSHLQPCKVSIIDSCRNGPKKLSKPIIEEIPKPSKESIQSRKEISSDLRSQMKGFLQKDHKNYKPLYKDGSSGDGVCGTGGSYSKFMSRCKVVDTSEIPESSNNGDGFKRKQDENSCLHAFGKGGKAFQSFPNKGFLNSSKNLDVSEADKQSGEFDVEFQDIMNRSDPVFATHFKDPRKEIENEGDALVKDLAHLSNIITGKKERDGTQTREENTSISREGQTEPEGGNKFISSTKKQLPYKIIQKGKYQIIEIDFSGNEVEVISLSMIDLEVSDSVVHFETPCKRSFYYETNNIDTERVTARFMKKKQKLKIYLYFL